MIYKNDALKFLNPLDLPIALGELYKMGKDFVMLLWLGGVILVLLVALLIKSLFGGGL